MDTPALELRDVVVRHSDGLDESGNPRMVTVLDGIDLVARRGESTSVVGASGSGKSTLLCVAAGLVAPDQGQVLLNGAEITSLPESARTAARLDQIAMVFQQPNLMASLTAREQVLLPLHIKGLRRSELRAQRAWADELLSMVGLSGLEGRRPHQLSGGQRQRVAIARALVGRPPLLLADEPTSALDQASSSAVMDLFSRLTAELSLATVMVTHDRELANLTDRMVAVMDGRLVELDEDEVIAA